MIKKLFYAIGVIIFIGILFNYNFIDSTLEDFFEVESYVEVERVIDGDTIVAGNQTIRLLGINTPERGEKYYREAKEYLEKIILNKTIKLEYGNEKKGRYGRTLAYIYFNGTNINKELVEKGYGNIYFPSGKTRYYKEFKEAWKRCIEKNIRLCESSEKVCGICVKIDKIDYENQLIILKNSCGKDCEISGWSLKDEGRKKYVFESLVLEGGDRVNIKIGEGKDNKTHIFWDKYTYVLTDSGDSVFLRDSEGKLVDWKSY